MIKAGLALVALAVAALGWQQRDPTPNLRLKEEVMFLEYSASENKAVVVVEAETEQGLDKVEVRTPSGQLILSIRTASGHHLGMSGFLVESREFDPAQLNELFRPGTYDLRARTVEGVPVVGSAELSLQLPDAPVIVYPQAGAEDVPTDLVVGWIPDSQATGYEVILEQNENDGLTVNLPAGTGSFQVPAGVLEPGTETLLEVGAIGVNGNRTLVEVVFTTW